MVRIHLPSKQYQADLDFRLRGTRLLRSTICDMTIRDRRGQPT